MVVFQEVTGNLLRAAANSAYNNGQLPLVAMFANDERIINQNFAVYCIFSGLNKGDFKVIKAILKQDEKLEFPSLVPIIPAAAWYEREIHDLFGIVPQGHPDLRRLVLHENWPDGKYPMRKDFNMDEDIEMTIGSYSMQSARGEGVFEVPVGPIHAGIIEPGHFRFSQAGENIISLDAKLFFTHRGIEKSVENLPADLALYKIERICGACTVSHAFSFSQAIENLAHVEIPVRAKYIRMIAAELERLYNHVGDVGNLCAGVGFSVGTSNGARMKEYLMRLNEYISGNRFLRGIIIPGGVNLDIKENDIREIGYELEILESDFKELVEILLETDAFLDRINHTGMLYREDAFKLGVVGVAARASGIELDIRRDHPYALYSTVDFKVPVYRKGDVASRLRVRIDEVFQSISLIRQIMDVMTYEGALNTKIPNIPPYTSGFGWSESARGSNLHWVMIGEKNKLYRCFVRSASYSNWPALTIAVPGNISPDFPLINKSFELCYACLDR